MPAAVHWSSTTVTRGPPSILLGTAYALTGSTFATSDGDGGANPVAFYANALLDEVDYDDAFTMTVLFSDNLASTTPTTTATYATVSSNPAQEAQVPAPNYTVTFGGHDLQTDFNQLVQTRAASSTCGHGSNDGEFYVISATPDARSDGSMSIDAAYAGDCVAVTPHDRSACLAWKARPFPRVRNISCFMNRKA